MKTVLSMLMVGMVMAMPAMAVETGIDPAVEKIVGALAEGMQNAQRLSCRMTLRMNNEMEGMKQEITTTYAVAAERPAKLAMRLVKGMPTFTVVSDGTNVYSHLPMMNRYSINVAPKTYDELFQAIGAMGATMVFVDNLLSSDVRAALLEGVKRATYAGNVLVNGQECDLLRFEQDEFDWELWVTRGATPVVLKVVADMTKGMGDAGDQAQGIRGMKMTVENVFEGWTVGAALSSDAFSFKPPENAKKAKTLFEDEETNEPVDVLEGMPAPAFSLNLLEGGKATVPVVTTNGPMVVILDFWASWSAPCRRTLPVVAKVASEYKDKGVIYYAVNQQEQPDQVKAFMEKEGIACAVPMDDEGKVGQAYQVQGIPQTVLIGTDGTVQAIHIGQIPDMEKILREQIDLLLKGKSLLGK